jgi:hypothetical protein
MKMKLDESDDFGFSLVSEDELKAHEDLLRQKIEEQSEVVQRTEAELKDKLDGLRAMIMPLLVNLAKDPDKSYIFWPDRVQKIEKFIKKVNTYVDG